MYCKKSRAIHVTEGGCEGGCLDDLALVTERRGCPADGAGTKVMLVNLFVERESRLGLRITARE